MLITIIHRFGKSLLDGLQNSENWSLKGGKVRKGGRVRRLLIRLKFDNNIMKIYLLSIVIILLARSSLCQQDENYSNEEEDFDIKSLSSSLAVEDDVKLDLQLKQADAWDVEEDSEEESFEQDDKQELDYDDADTDLEAKRKKPSQHDKDDKKKDEKHTTHKCRPSRRHRHHRHRPHHRPWFHQQHSGQGNKPSSNQHDTTGSNKNRLSTQSYINWGNDGGKPSSNRDPSNQHQQQQQQQSLRDDNKRTTQRYKP
ncbi:unnamed protein product [Didymodactylos carnosus]|uniref:Uncharacterized protein n=1 Tax=Didymodactylos carnosus TaxID=1234261 RepID=A0A813YQZ5_9BILA|nr:unnamed protein product [Didymodactylos carnosus]CAF3672731.1 unnamed protein product [Didymodactylos carnosus]